MVPYILMDALQEYVKNNLVSKENVLKYVDDYSIYSYYIGNELELRTKYTSPLRLGDDDPSFSMYYSDKYKGKIFFKDQSTGATGDVFQFLRNLMGNGILANTRDVLLQINRDFGLGLDGEDVGTFKPHLIKAAPVKRAPTRIEITAYISPTKEFKAFWGELEISEQTLKIYYVKDVRVIHYIAEYHKSILARTLTISYEILGHYKIYQPFATKEFKFRNDYLDLYVEGALQLKFESDFCIITKSTKEIVFFYEHFGWESVAGKSENIPINSYFMNSVLKKNYKKVFIWLDTDEAGIKAQEKYLRNYPWLIPITFDKFINQKDATDLFLAAKRSGKKELALNYLKQLITKQL